MFMAHIWAVGDSFPVAFAKLWDAVKPDRGSLKQY